MPSCAPSRLRERRPLQVTAATNLPTTRPTMSYRRQPKAPATGLHRRREPISSLASGRSRHRPAHHSVRFDGFRWPSSACGNNRRPACHGFKRQQIETFAALLVRVEISCIAARDGGLSQLIRCPLPHWRCGTFRQSTTNGNCQSFDRRLPPLLASRCPGTKAGALRQNGLQNGPLH